jgi:hypothetical protein
MNAEIVAENLKNFLEEEEAEFRSREKAFLEKLIYQSSDEEKSSEIVLQKKLSSDSWAKA